MLTHEELQAKLNELIRPGSLEVGPDVFNICWQDHPTTGPRVSFDYRDSETNVVYRRMTLRQLYILRHISTEEWRDIDVITCGPSDPERGIYRYEPASRAAAVKLRDRGLLDLSITNGILEGSFLVRKRSLQLDVGYYPAETENAWAEAVRRLNEIQKDYPMMPLELEHELFSMLDEFKRQSEELDSYGKALCSDAELTKYLHNYLYSLHWSDDAVRSAPIVRAATYEKVEGEQELPVRRINMSCWKITDRDPRRPVFMRGSRHCLHIKYGASTYYFRVAKRYLRRIGYTCFDKRLHADNMACLKIRIFEKYREHFSTNSRFLNPTDTDLYVEWNRDECTIWVKGKHYIALSLRFPGQAKQETSPPMPPQTLPQPEMQFPRRARERGMIVLTALKELGIEV
jgi:hypothetical protein